MERKTIGYHRISHLVERQYQNEEAMRKELECGNYTAEHPYIVVNPYLVNPLTAMILFKTEKEEAVTLTVKELPVILPIHFRRRRSRSFRCLGSIRSMTIRL